MLTNDAKTSVTLHLRTVWLWVWKCFKYVRFSVLCSRNYLSFENRSNSMDTASLKSKVLRLITLKVDSFSMDTLVPAFLPVTLTFRFLELPTAVPFHYVKTFTYYHIFWIPRFLLKLYIIKKMQGGSVGCFTSKKKNLLHGVDLMGKSFIMFANIHDTFHHRHPKTCKQTWWSAGRPCAGYPLCSQRDHHLGHCAFF